MFPSCFYRTEYGSCCRSTRGSSPGYILRPAPRVAHVGRRGERRRATRWRGLLEGVRELEQRRLAPCPADERDPHRKAAHEAHRHRDVWIARNGGGRRERGASARVAVHEVDQIGRPLRGRDDRVELVLGDRRVDALRAHQTTVLRELVAILLLGKGPLLHRLLHDLLPEVAQLTCGVLRVER